MRNLGVVFIVLGVVGAIGIVATFDYSYYDLIKDSLAREGEAVAMKADLFMRWVGAIASVLVCTAIGLILMALDKMIKLIESNRAETIRVKEIIHNQK